MQAILITIIFVFFSFSAWTQKPVRLKFNLEQNKVYRLRSESQQNMSQTMGGMQQNTNINTRTDVSLKVMEKSEDFMVVEFRFDTIIVNTNTAGMSFEINSSLPGELESDNIGEVLSVFMNRYCSNPLYAKMSYEGKIIEFINLRLFTDFVIKDIDSIKSQMAQFIKGRAKMMAEPGAIQTSVESIMAYLPGTSENIGDSWDLVLEMNSGGMKYMNKNHYTLDEVKDDVAYITIESTIDPANSEPVVIDGNTITNNIRGTSKSSLTVEAKSGMLIESTGKYHMEGDVGVNAQGRDMLIPMTIEGETKIIGLH